MRFNSVELLQEWERYFGISIPKKESEQIDTVHHAVKCIGDLLKLTEQGIGKKELFARLQQALIRSGLTTRLVRGNELATYYLPHDNEPTWQRLADVLELEIPMPDVTNNNTNPRIIFFRKPRKQGYDYARVTFDNLTEVIAGANYLKLAEGKKAETILDVYAAVLGITADRTGADLYEITRNSPFAGDLDID
jgi:hypothetical protein